LVQIGQNTYLYFQPLDDSGNDKTSSDDLESDIHSDPEINSDSDHETDYETDFLLDNEINSDPFDPDYQYYGFTFNPESSTGQGFTFEPGYTFPPGFTDQPFSDGFTFPPDFTFDPSTNYPWTTPYPLDFTTDNYFSAFTIPGKDFLPVKSATCGATGLLEYRRLAHGF